MDDPEVPLRLYIERIIDERHRLYQTQFNEAEKRVMLALASQRHEQGDSHWSIGTLIAIVLSLAAVAGVFLKR